MPAKKSAAKAKPVSSHLKAGLFIGTLIGVGSAMFMQSGKGKQMAKDVEKKSAKLQEKLMKQLENAHEMTKEKYEQLVDTLTDHYVKTKEVSEKEVPEIRKSLMKSWSSVEKMLKSVR